MNGGDGAKGTTSGRAAEPVRGADGHPRCRLPSADPRYVRYHDVEWGRPVADDTRLYEKVCLEGFQSGLAWSTVLYRREAFREAFAGFDIDTVARYDAYSVARLMRDPRLIRNRRKIESAINNARRARALRDEAGSLGAFFWSFEPDADVPPTTVPDPFDAAARLAGALKARGWTFVGPTTMHALMQALGLVNDHVEGCWVRDDVERARAAFARPPRRPFDEDKGALSIGESVRTRSVGRVTVTGTPRTEEHAMFDKTECAHEPCTCKIGSDGDGGIVAEDGRHYCSEGCRKGEGCVCPACGCSMDTVDGDGSPVPMI